MLLHLTDNLTLFYMRFTLEQGSQTQTGSLWGSGPQKTNIWETAGHFFVVNGEFIEAMYSILH